MDMPRNREAASHPPRGQSLTQTASITAILLVLGTPAMADIDGFGTLEGWAYNQADSAAPPSFVGDGVQLSYIGTSFHRRSLMYESPQDITGFVARYTYRGSHVNACCSCDNVVVLTFHNDPTGPAALGGGSCEEGGYAGIGSSVGVALHHEPGNGYGTFVGLWQDGVPGTLIPIPEIDAGSDQPIEVSASFDGTNLTIEVDDPAFGTGPEFSMPFFLPDLHEIVGGTSAYVGVTLQTGTGADQIIGDLTFTSSEQPADLDGDGVVGITDLFTILANWGVCQQPCPPTCTADINEDCVVDIADLLLVLANWS